MDDPLRLTELVASRLCHDFGGLLSTVSAALEMASETPGAPVHTLTPASEATADLMRRLHLLREAWSGGSTALDLPALRNLAGGLPGGHRLTLDLSGLPRSTAFPPTMARVILNVLLLAAESLPRGGNIGLAAAGGEDILVTISGPRGGWPPVLASCLADEEAAWSALSGPRTMMAPLVALLAKRSGIRVSMMLPSGRVRRAMPPLLLSPESAE
jgi:histidine phosphotransferase ChpT